MEAHGNYEGQHLIQQTPPATYFVFFSGHIEKTSVGELQFTQR